jgi:peptidoglycan/xylan/chitin deacetylase (PgdA/CDA1 family)
MGEEENQGAVIFMPKIALTYDDGPDTRWTRPLLEILKRHNVVATFFMVGRYVRQRQDVAKAVVDAGHAIGNHTFSHPPLTQLPNSQIDDELEQCERALTEVVGVHPTLFRPPFRDVNDRVRDIASRRGLKTVEWDADGQDWILPKTPEEIDRMIASKIHADSIILLHDGFHQDSGADRSASVDATELLISRYKGKGFDFIECW